MPSLKERQEDILLFANFFLDQANHELDRHLIGFDAAASNALQTYSWPGNLRQLKNIVKRATLLAQGSYITLTELGYELVESSSASPTSTSLSLHDEATEKEAHPGSPSTNRKQQKQSSPLIGHRPQNTV